MIYVFKIQKKGNSLPEPSHYMTNMLSAESQSMHVGVNKAEVLQGRFSC